MMAYEESLKVYRDLKAVTDTAYEDGYKEAESEYTAKLQEEKRQKEEEKRQKENAIKLLLSSGITPKKISEQLNIAIEFIERLKSS